jgi:hypothetical protein
MKSQATAVLKYFEGTALKNAGVPGRKHMGSNTPPRIIVI